MLADLCHSLHCYFSFTDPGERELREREKEKKRKKSSRSA
jgi:hypothetical protein